MELQILKLTALIALFLTQISCQEEASGETSAVKPWEHTFVREIQYVRRYNCSGEMVSQGEETINSLAKTYQVEAESMRDLWSFRAHGDLGEYRGHLVENRGQFTVDLSPTVFNIRVREGLNEIRYQFGYCSDVRVDPENAEEYCGHAIEFTREKSFWLLVKYRVKNLTGVKDIHPSSESCES
ncbi:MAG: hypothetical protein CME65_02480 [Halobacteriovoraceae bacterium]|nr:hypothetical protein [Halobacteriovoraceae bacterium]|tara:strand:+ start:6621 stop:7169 length:549 start_codon:yes stop_codon:yes gene_type:complete